MFENKRVLSAHIIVTKKKKKKHSIYESTRKFQITNCPQQSYGDIVYETTEQLKWQRWHSTKTLMLAFLEWNTFFVRDGTLWRTRDGLFVLM